MTGRIEGIIGVGWTTLVLPIRTDSTQIPKCPSRCIRSPRDIASVGFKEEYDVLWVSVGRAPEEGDEHHHDSPGHEEYA